MAIQKDVISDIGLPMTNAYIKVVEYSSVEDNVIHARLRAYVSREFEQQGKSHIEGSEDLISFTADYSDGSPNTKKQIYQYAKTLPLYSDAVDILE